MKFNVELSNRAEKQLRGLDAKTRLVVREALFDMEEDPYMGDYKKLKAGQGHRRRVGRYRITYEIDTDLRLVSVYGILPRKDAYR